MSGDDRESLERAKQEARSELGGLEGVNGIGIAWEESGRPCLRVNVLPSAPEETLRRIPAMIRQGT